MEERMLKILKYIFMGLTLLFVFLWGLFPIILSPFGEFSLRAFFTQLVINPFLFIFVICGIMVSIISLMIKDPKNPAKKKIILLYVITGLALVLLAYWICLIFIPVFIDFTTGAINFWEMLNLMISDPYLISFIILWIIPSILEKKFKLALAPTLPPPPVSQIDQGELLNVAKEYLVPNEKVVNIFSPLTYNLLLYNCIITNHRILLLTEDKGKFIEIDHRMVSTLLLETEKIYGSIALAICGIILGGLFIILGTTFKLNALTSLGIICIIVGIISLLATKTQAKYYLQMQVGSERFQLYSTQNLLINLINEIRQLKYGADGALRSATPIGPVSSPLETSNLKYCIHCGAQILAVATFCNKCGKKQE